MKPETFIDEIDNLVREWNSYEGGRGSVPRKQLEAIYFKLREHTVHDIAKLVEAHDRVACDKANLTAWQGKA